MVDQNNTSPKYPAEFYVNGSSTRMGIYDVTMLFSFGREAEDGTFNQEPVANVILAPTQFKVLALALIEQLKAYEEFFGQIPLNEKFHRVMQSDEIVAAMAIPDSSSKVRQMVGKETSETAPKGNLRSKKPK